MKKQDILNSIAEQYLAGEVTDECIIAPGVPDRYGYQESSCGPMASLRATPLTTTFCGRSWVTRPRVSPRPPTTAPPGLAAIPLT